MDPIRRSFRHLSWNVLGTYGGAWLWVLAFVALVQTFAQATIAGFPPLSATLSLLARVPEVNALLAANPYLTVFMALVFAPVFEEAVFRMLPLTFVIGKEPRKIFAVQFAVCGVLFGIIHGHPVNVFIQGFVGFMLGRLYVKNHVSQATAYASCVFVHCAYNFSVMAATLVS